MKHWIAQRGTRVAVVEAPTAREAATVAARALRLPEVDRHQNSPLRDLWSRCWSRHPYRVVDWRRATIRPATVEEVDRFTAAHDQDRALSSKTKIAQAVRS